MVDRFFHSADIVRARLRTYGVEEHRLVLENSGVGSEWFIYDVGGSRHMVSNCFVCIAKGRQGYRIITHCISLYSVHIGFPILTTVIIILVTSFRAV